MSIYLYYGDDFLVLDELRKIKNNVKVFLEFWGFDDAEVDLNEILGSFSIFGDKKNIIIRDFIENNKLSPLIDSLVFYIERDKEILLHNDIYLFQYGAVSSNLKLYKIIAKLGYVNEFKKPDTRSILNNVKKKLNITNDAAIELINKTSANLFAIKNEIAKLKYLDTVSTKEINLYVIDIFDNTNIWGVADLFLDFVLLPNLVNFKTLITYINTLLNRNVEEMFILNVFYNSIFKLITLIESIEENKNKNELIHLVGYYFCKKYFDKVKNKNLLNVSLKINKILLNYEYDFKSGLVDSNLGLKKALIQIYLSICDF